MYSFFLTIQYWCSTLYNLLTHFYSILFNELRLLFLPYSILFHESKILFLVHNILFHELRLFFYILKLNRWFHPHRKCPEKYNWNIVKCGLVLMILSYETQWCNQNMIWIVVCDIWILFSIFLVKHVCLISVGA